MSAFQPKNPDFAAAIAGYAAAQGFLSLLGVTLGRIEPGLAEYRLVLRPELRQQDGVFHGGVVGGLAEAVMGAAAKTLVAAGANVVGVEYKCNFAAPAAGPVLLARGVVVRPGRRLIVCRADVLSRSEETGEETLAAIGQGTMAVIEPRAA